MPPREIKERPPSEGNSAKSEAAKSDWLKMQENAARGYSKSGPMAGGDRPEYQGGGPSSGGRDRDQDLSDRRGGGGASAGGNDGRSALPDKNGKGGSDLDRGTHL